MRYNVGFDLGTHQTKICIEDSINAAEKIYEFLEFAKPDGTKTILFPSMVQINIDGTVSYGYADESQCLQLEGKAVMKPVSISLIDMPAKPSMPPKRKAQYPKRPIEDPWKDSLLKLKGEKTTLETWKEKCEKIDHTLEQEWHERCEKLMKEYENQCARVKDANLRAQEMYYKQVEVWKKSMEKEFCRFRYFKLRSFTDSGTWTSRLFDSKEISVWYIAYILLILWDKLGQDDIAIQFGAPVSGSGMIRDKMIVERAYSLYIAAYNLAKEYNTIEDYLSATYTELREKTKIEKVSDDIIDQYIFDDIPEAFAGLIAATRQKKMGIGFHILADIGGGTTDMAMFYVDSKTHLPDVITILSFSKGLNYIFERTKETEKLSLEMLQEKFFNSPKSTMFKKAVREYNKAFADNGLIIQNKLLQSFDQSREHHGRRRHELENALKDHPIVYCGGGSIYPSLHIPFGFFTDKKYIDKQLLNIKNVRNGENIPNELFAILAISYGLASYEKNLDVGIKCTDVSVVFHKCLPKAKSADFHNEYGLLDD